MKTLVTDHLTLSVVEP